MVITRDQSSGVRGIMGKVFACTHAQMSDQAEEPYSDTGMSDLRTENDLDCHSQRENEDNFCDDGKESNDTKTKLPCVHYENSLGLSKDLGLLASMPELYDVHFVVGRTKQPIGAIRAILAARSRVFYKLLGYTRHTRSISADLYIKRQDSSLCSKRFSKKQGKFSLKREASFKFDSKSSSPARSNTIAIEEFEVEEFSRLMEYLHYGTCSLEARYSVGLMAAAEYANVDELKHACSSFIERILTIDTVCHLLCCAENHIQFKSTKCLIPKLLDFVSEHAQDVLCLPAFQSLPQQVVRLILSRGNLKASEVLKFNAALTWSRAYCKKEKKEPLKHVMKPLIECIAFYDIPTFYLINEIRHLGIVPDHILMNALAYKEDPASVDVTPESKRVSTATGILARETESQIMNNERDILTKNNVDRDIAKCDDKM